MTLAALVALAACGAAPAPVERGAAPGPPGATAIADPGDATGAGVTPTAYALELLIDPDSSGFIGTITIELDVTARTSELWLDASELQISSAILTRPGATAGAPAQVIDVRRAIDAPRGRVGFVPDAPLTPGPARLELRFAGLYRLDDGIFAQAYRARTYVYSDFEPTDARRAFPCFDEPRFKTPWTVALIVPRGQVALSNTAAVRTVELDDDHDRVEFATTPPLPSYLVALAVGPFELVDVEGGPVPLRIVVPEGRRAAAARAAAFAPEILSTAVALLERPVPFDKLDLIAVPRFGGAMENPGLVTVAADILLGSGGDAFDRKLGLVLAHEAAHLWFGDWMTLTDWRDLWIQEGTATWLADEVLARWRPAWATRRDELRARAEAMRDDELPDARALRPDEVDGPRALFDVLTYQKSAAVLHMIEAWVGAPRFYAALRELLDARAWGHATSDEFIAALATAAGPEGEDAVRATLTSFVARAGVPHLDVELRCEGRPRVQLTPRVPGWSVPVCVRWSDDGVTAQERCALVDEPRELTLGDRCPAWLHPNADAAGYYRWSLRGTTLAATLAGAPATDRERLDAAHMFRAALADGTPLLELAEALAVAAASDLPELVERALAEYQLLVDQLAPAAARAEIARHLRAALAPTVRRLGTHALAGEAAAPARLRPLVLAGAGGLGGERKLIAWARKATRRWLAGKPVDDALVEAALTVAASHADATLADALVAAAGRSLDELSSGRDHTPLLGRALTRLPAARALAALAAGLDGAMHSGTTFTLAVGLLSRADTAAATAALLVERGDWLTFTAPFAALCEPGLLDQIDRNAARDPAFTRVLDRRRTEAERCAALRPARGRRRRRVPLTAPRGRCRAADAAAATCTSARRS